MIIRTFSFSVIWFLSFVALSSCNSYDSNDVNQQRINTSYSFSYIGDEDIFKASASFTFGANYLELSEPAYVSFEGITLKKHDFLGVIVYGNDFSNEYSSGVFYYRDQNSDSYSNTVSMINSVNATPFTSISISEGGDLTWIGEPIQNGEKVEVILSKDGTTFTKSTEAIGAKSIQVNATEIPGSFIGTVDILFKRTRQFGLQEKTEEGGKIRVEYSSVTRSINITE